MTMNHQEDPIIIVPISLLMTMNHQEDPITIILINTLRTMNNQDGLAILILEKISISIMIVILQLKMITIIMLFSIEVCTSIPCIHSFIEGESANTKERRLNSYLKEIYMLIQNQKNGVQLTYVSSLYLFILPL